MSGCGEEAQRSQESVGRRGCQAGRPREPLHDNFVFSVSVDGKLSCAFSDQLGVGGGGQEVV